MNLLIKNALKWFDKTNGAGNVLHTGHHICRQITFLWIPGGVICFTLLFSTESASALHNDQLPPPLQWGEEGARECMIETADRWHRYEDTPMPSSDISTHGPPVPAFPGAEGFGANAFGGRGGEIYRVTNLNDSGPGSLREAAEAEEPRLIIFDVSGTIELDSPIRVYNPYMTIAGQTAPGDGITVANRQFDVRTYDVIIRHLRFRHGNDGEYHGDEWMLRIRGGNHVILDHVTVTWGVDGNLGVTHMDNATVQHSMLAKPLWNSIHPKGTRGYGALVRGRHGASYSFIRNLWTNNRTRVPRPGNYLNHEEDPDGLLVDFRNNVVFQGIGTNYDEESITRYNFINNYFLTDWHLIDESTQTQSYLSGNFHMQSKPKEQWDLIDAGENVDRTYHEQQQPFEAGDVTTLSSEEAWQQVMENAGAWIRDEHDINVIREVRNYYRSEIGGGSEQYDLPDYWKTGPIDDQAEVGGLPDLENQKMPEWIDSNRNGIPDWWEQAQGLDSSNPDIAHEDSNGNGYTHIEEYINDLKAIRITHMMAGFSP